ncbi:MAG TPA: cytochrome c [Burkholderiales bacterium]
MRALLAILAVLALLVAAAAGIAYSGAYNVAADEPHWRLTERLLALVRERSIEARAGRIDVPDLEDAKRIAEGAGHYAEMCQGCHLAPGMEDTELRKGLQPRPTDLTRERVDPRRAFWIVKHGIKMTGMPAWGTTHDDETLWGVVAFLRKLPGMDEQRYRELVARAGPHSPMQHGEPAGKTGHSHSHSHGAKPHTH